MRARLALALAAVGIAAALGCNAIFGFDSATLDTATDAGDGGASTDGPVAIGCGNYCPMVMSACRDANAPYLDDNTCAGFCAVMALGDAGSIDTDTVACRQAFAATAAVETAASCRSAGPLGNSTCGANLCEVYCRLNLAICANLAYASQAECTAACAHWPFNPAITISDETFDTLNCRNYHLQAAIATGNKALHCPHTKDVSTNCIQDAGARD